jgi:hypothetical protein
MVFDGILCQGEPLKIKRPHDYNPSVGRHSSKQGVLCRRNSVETV